MFSSKNRNRQCKRLLITDRKLYVHVPLSRIHTYRATACDLLLYHRIVGIEGTSRDHWGQPPCQSRLPICHCFASKSQDMCQLKRINNSSVLHTVWVVDRINYREATTKDKTGEKLERNGEMCSRSIRKIKPVR